MSGESGGVKLALLLAGGVIVAAALAGLKGPLVTAVVTVAAVLLLIGTVVYWRALDEAAREAHKWSWYWGGSAGLLLAGFIVGAGRAADGFDWRRFFSASTDFELVAAGVLVCVCLQVACYGVAWVFWWLSRR